MRKKTRVKTRVRFVHVRGRNTGGLLRSNPIVAAQVGAAAGSLLAAAWQENPNMFEDAVPYLEKYGRLHEREDIIALLERGKITLKQLVATLRSGTHEGMGKAAVAVALEKLVAEFKALYGM